MSKFVAISGPASTGKTTIVDKLNSSPDMYKSICSPDMYNVVWLDLVEQGHFKDFTEISKDSEYLSLYILRVVNYYIDYINTFKNTDKLVVLDGSWIDFSIYAIINMWYLRYMRSFQEAILSKILLLKDLIDCRIYFTQYDESKEKKERFRNTTKLYNTKESRELEIAYYRVMEDFKNSIILPTTDGDEASLFIINDLKKIGYL